MGVCANCGAELVAGAAFCHRCDAPVDGAPVYDDYDYEVFISYRHLPLDRSAAIKIQRSIEGFAIPRQLRGVAGKKRLGKCFRDEDELPTSSSLSSQIESALKRSRYQIVICGKETPQSIWVRREVELFLSYHGRDKVLVALVEGEPEDSFPDLLLSKLERGDDGSIRQVPIEPLAANMRDLRRPVFNVEKCRIISTLAGCSFDDLRQRMKVRRARSIAAAASGIAVASAVFGGVAMYQQAQIAQGYRLIQTAQSEFLAEESSNLLTQGDRYQAVQVALAALPGEAAGGDRPFVPAAQMALANALGVYPAYGDWASCYSQTSVADRGLAEYVCFGPDGLEATLARDGYVEIRQTTSGDLVSRFDAESSLSDQRPSAMDCTMCFADERLIVVADGALGCFDVYSGSLNWSITLDVKNDYPVFVSPDGMLVSIVETPGSSRGGDVIVLHVLNAADGEKRASIDLPGYERLGYDKYWGEDPCVVLASDEQSAVVCWWKTVFQVDLTSGSYKQQQTLFDKAISVRCIDDAIIVLTQDENALFETDYQVGLQVFDSDLELLWQTNLDMHIDALHDVWWKNPDVYGTWCYYGGDDLQYVVQVGSDLYLLDTRTGKEECHIAFDALAVGCTVQNARGHERIIVCTADGVLHSRTPFESNSGRGGMAYDQGVMLGKLRYASFCEADGGVFVSMWTNDPLKRLVYRFSKPEDLVEDRLLGLGAVAGEVEAIAWDERSVVLRLQEQVTILDTATFLPISTVPFEELEGIDPDGLSMKGDLTNTGDYYLLAGIKEVDNFGNHMKVYRISSGGKPSGGLFSIEINPIAFNACQSPEGRTLLTIVGSGLESNRVVVVDPDDPENTFDHAVLDAKRAWYVGPAVIVCSGSQSSTDGYSFTLLDSQTGTTIESDISHYALRANDRIDGCAAISSDRTRFAIACSDGLLRLFDSESGALLWETNQAPSRVQMVAITNEGNVFVQDAFGMCVLVSGVSGEILQASSAAAPLIVDAVHRDEDNVLIAYYQDTGNYSFTVMEQTGILVFSLNESAFGPLAIINNGRFFSADGRLVAYKDERDGALHVARVLSTDELIERANELVEGHELTDSERHLYHVD